MVLPEDRELLCVFGLLRSPQRLPALVALLPEPERSRVGTLVERLQALSEAQLKQRITDLRVAATSNVRVEVSAKIGVSLDRIPERLQWWIANQGQSAHGRENH